MSVAVTTKPEPSLVQMTDVASYIADEMARNARSTIASNMAADLNSLNPFAVKRGVQSWIALVWPNADWDHKNRIIAKFGLWSADIMSERDYNYDIWSNIHFGFLGRRVGFSNWTLLSGGGFGQIIVNRSPDGYWERRLETLGDADFLAAFDDPADQAAIKLGARLWRSYAYAVSGPAVANAVRTGRGLQTRPAAEPER